MPNRRFTFVNHARLTLALLSTLFRLVESGTFIPLAVKPLDYSRRSFGRVLVWTLTGSISTHSHVRFDVAHYSLNYVTFSIEPL